MTDRITELHNAITEKLAILKSTCQESFTKSAELTASFRQNLDLIESPEQRQIVAEIVDHNELFSNMIMLLAESSIESLSELQLQAYTATQNAIETLQRGQELISDHLKPNTN